jgi:hypothetical protein
MVLAAKRGKLKNVPPKIAKVASGVSQTQASEFASDVEPKKKRSGVARTLAAKD